MAKTETKKEVKCILFHVRDDKNSPLTHTLAFDYDTTSRKLFCAWSRVNTTIGIFGKRETYSKKMGYEIATVRLQRMMDYDAGIKGSIKKSYRLPDDIGVVVAMYLPKVVRYFKEMHNSSVPVTFVLYKSKYTTVITQEYIDRCIEVVEQCQCNTDHEDEDFFLDLKI